MSRLERIIDEIESYLDSCKYQALSKNSILVDKKFIDSKLKELRNLIPDESKKYQTILNNKDAILEHARQQAHSLIDDATNKRNELIDETEVMKQAYEQAGDVVKKAAEQAGELLDEAQTQANEMKEAAVRYTDALLHNVEKTLQASMDSTSAHLGDLMDDFKSYQDTVKKNRAALSPPKAKTDADLSAAKNTAQTESGYSSGYVHSESKARREAQAKLEEERRRYEEERQMYEERTKLGSEKEEPAEKEPAEDKSNGDE